MKHLGTVILETDRLRLRPITLEDVPMVFDNWVQDPEVARYVTWEVHRSQEVTEGYIGSLVAAYASQESSYDWGIEVKETGELIGSLSFVGVSDRDQVAELGYCLGRNWWGQGYMTEAVAEILRFAFEEVGFNRVQAVFDQRNPASGRVMEKVGMIYEGTMREVRKVKGEFVTIKLYAILKSDWEKIKLDEETVGKVSE